jgi:hypothetical protein
MTIKDYIAGKLEHSHLTLNDSDWADIERSVSLTASDTEENIRKAFLVLATKILPFYQNQASSVSENGFSISFYEKEVNSLQSWLCNYLGIEDSLNEETSISDISDFW